MSGAKTLFELAGASLKPAGLDEASLLLIDLQNEYRSGPLALPRVDPAIACAARLLAKARSLGTPIVHIAHKGRPGGMFDRDAARGQIVDALAPRSGEPVVEKALPNAFAGTELQKVLAGCGRKQLLVVGFMTHMCVSSTARAALDLGFQTTIEANACATRDLPDGRGGIISADTLHEVALAELSDRFAMIARGSDGAS